MKPILPRPYGGGGAKRRWGTYPLRLATLGASPAKAGEDQENRTSHLSILCPVGNASVLPR